MGSGLSQNAADTHQSDVSTPTKSAVSTTSTWSDSLPHEFEAILKDTDTDIDKSSIDKLYAGVFLNQKGKYWVDKASNCNCFFVFIRDLSITWGDTSCYWHWPCIEETSEVALDVGELLDVCWLEIEGRFEISKLTPGIKYEVVFVVMMKYHAYGWEVPINIILVLPDGTKQEHKENMMEKPQSKWFEIPADEFMDEAKKGGFVMFPMFEYDCLAWKNGLVVKGVAIRLKN